MAKQQAHELIQAQVLVLGGGPAGVWAALEAARAGASVALADKGYCGVSGAAAASNNNIWYVPDSTQYPLYFEEGYLAGGSLSEQSWVEAVLETAVRQLHFMSERGYRFPVTESGARNYGTLRGPDYMRFMRSQLRKSKVRILDHSPVQQLLVADGQVTGARGERLNGEPWQVSASATVIATGGCAFLSGVLGTNVCTGDGHLAAGEAGVTFSGMEFSNQYGMAASFSTVTKGLPFHWASYYDEEGHEIDLGAEEPFVAIARASRGGRIFACYDKASADVQRWLRSGQAIAFMPFDRMGIDPFRQRFELSLRLEGTVRGTGGIELRGRDCSTNLPGLYAAGDAASREPIVGGRSGGGSPNAAWAMSTGSWAGQAAARFALAQGESVPAGRTASELIANGADLANAMQVIQEELWSVERNVFRSETGLKQALQRLDEAWGFQKANRVQRSAREVHAMLYVGRLAYTSALNRRESTALHQRVDYPLCSPDAPYRQRVWGVEKVEIERVAASGGRFHD
ncbi:MULTISPECIES: FAD-binding protein [Pseudomonas]|uniref:FAD-binding protein n=1 Tax=Pseudomonas capeferrum TaxID=1495066 RepID=A0ABY7R3R7_9PSED|nr:MULTISPECIES: FAD-binding protein [Pseudomonas]MUT49686.1 FAD-binding protein [Pseudomonas sp. TDA1]WCH98033.1 FAD-binding protein [Pseudomonas capeferrum]